MKLTLKDGSKVERTFQQAVTQGWRIESIEIDSVDVMQMRLVALLNPQGFQTMMLQLQARFPDERSYVDDT